MAISETKIIQTILNFLDLAFIYNMLPKKGKKVKWGVRINKRGLSIFFWSVFCVWFVAFLLYSNIKIFQKRTDLGKELEKLDNNIETLSKEKDSLKFSLGETYSQEYLEKVAREDLGMQKAGETVVVIKKNNQESSSAEKTNVLQNILNWFNSLFKPE
jgi:cell division protein FtsB